MPTKSIENFAKKSGKSVAEVEKLWSKAKGIVAKQYKDVPPDSEYYYKLVTGTLKNMLGLTESTNTGKTVENETTLTFEELVDKELDKLNEEADKETKDDMETDSSDEETEEEDEDGKKKKKKKKSDEDDESEEEVKDADDK